MDWVLAGIVLVGNFVLIKSRRWYSFVILGIGNFGYMIYWFTKQEWATMILVFIFLCQNIYGMYSWWKREQAIETTFRKAVEKFG